MCVFQWRRAGTPAVVPFAALSAPTTAPVVVTSIASPRPVRATSAGSENPQPPSGPQTLDSMSVQGRREIHMNRCKRKQTRSITIKTGTSVRSDTSR